MTRKIVYHFEGVDYFRFSVYRMKMNVQTVYTFFVDGVLIDTAQRHNRINIYQQLKYKKLIKYY
jgi:hypothetical protein